MTKEVVPDVVAVPAASTVAGIGKRITSSPGRWPGWPQN